MSLQGAPDLFEDRRVVDGRRHGPLVTVDRGLVSPLAGRGGHPKTLAH
jgi:hypothetical protein